MKYIEGTSIQNVFFLPPCFFMSREKIPKNPKSFRNFQATFFGNIFGATFWQHFWGNILATFLGQHFSNIFGGNILATF